MLKFPQLDPDFLKLLNFQSPLTKQLRVQTISFCSIKLLKDCAEKLPLTDDDKNDLSTIISDVLKSKHALVPYLKEENKKTYILKDYLPDGMDDNLSESSLENIIASLPKENFVRKSIKYYLEYYRGKVKSTDDNEGKVEKEGKEDRSTDDDL